MDRRVLAFTLAASVLTGILFGLAPALQISKSDVQESIKESGTRRIGQPAAQSFAQASLIVGEVALSVVLLARRGSVVSQSCFACNRSTPGSVRNKCSTLRLSPAGTNFATDADYIKYYDQVLEG